MKKWLLICLAVALPVQAIAAKTDSGDEDTGLISFNAGRVGVLDEDAPWRYGLEYRFAPQGDWELQPTVGVARAENDSRFFYFEVRRDFLLTDDWFLTPSFGVGSFDGRRDLQLGHTIEFRSGLELAYRFQSGNRLGLAVFHLSNGGISEENPGTEAVVATFSLPYEFN